jgi:hypothetical protein
MAELCFQPGKIVLPGNESVCLKRNGADREAARP